MSMFCFLPSATKEEAEDPEEGAESLQPSAGASVLIGEG